MHLALKNQHNQFIMKYLCLGQNLSWSCNQSKIINQSKVFQVDLIHQMISTAWNHMFLLVLHRPRKKKCCPWGQVFWTIRKEWKSMGWSWHPLHRKWWKRSLRLKSTQSRNASRRRIQEEETNTRKHPLASHRSLWNLKWETNSNFSFRKEWPIETARRCPSLSLRARSRPWGATRGAKRLCSPCRHTKMRKQDKARTICSTDLTLLGLAESSRSIKCEKVWTCRKEKNRRPRRWSHHSPRLSTEPRSKRL